MQDAMDRHDLAAVINGQEDAIVPNAQAVPLRAAEFFDLGTARLQRQQRKALEDEQAKRLGDRPQIAFDPPIVDEVVHELDQAVSLEAEEEFFVGNRAAACADGSFERFRISQVFNEMDQLPVIDQRQHDCLRFAAAVD